MKEEKQREIINKVKTWEELYRSILEIGDVIGSREIIRTPEENIESAVGIKKAILPLNAITRSAGLREKVIELLNL